MNKLKKNFKGVIVVLSKHLLLKYLHLLQGFQSFSQREISMEMLVNSPFLLEELEKQNNV